MFAQKKHFPYVPRAKNTKADDAVENHILSSCFRFLSRCSPLSASSSHVPVGVRSLRVRKRGIVKASESSTARERRSVAIGTGLQICPIETKSLTQDLSQFIGEEQRQASRLKQVQQRILARIQQHGSFNSCRDRGQGGEDHRDSIKTQRDHAQGGARSEESIEVSHQALAEQCAAAQDFQGVMIWTSSMLADNRYIEAIKKSTKEYDNIVTNLKGKKESADDIREKVGIPCVWAFNGAMKELLKEKRRAPRTKSWRTSRSQPRAGHGRRCIRKCHIFASARCAIKIANV